MSGNDKTATDARSSPTSYGYVVSAICSSLDPSSRIEEALMSIPTMPKSALELIVCDDGSSTAGTERIVRALCGASLQGGAKLFLRNTENKGLPASLNRCASFSSGRYLMRVDDDDVNLPGRIDGFAELIHQAPNTHVVGAAAIFEFEESGRRLVQYDRSHSDIVHRMRHRNPVNHPTAFIDSFIFRKAGGYRELFKFGCEDWDLWLRIEDIGGIFANHSRPGILYRYPLNSAYSMRKNKARLRSELELARFHDLGAMFRLRVVLIFVKNSIRGMWYRARKST